MVEISETPSTKGFDAKMAGKRAECDGGGPSYDRRHISRQDFTGTLTGDYVEEGDPAWRWYLMKDLTVKPDGFPSEAVWCEAGNIYLIDDSK